MDMNKALGRLFVVVHICLDICFPFFVKCKLDRAQALNADVKSRPALDCYKNTRTEGRDHCHGAVSFAKR